MKPGFRTLVAAAFLLSACGAEHWDGGGRRQELPMDQRTPEAGSASIDTGGTAATLVPDEGSGAGASGEGGAPGAGGSLAAGASTGPETAGTAPLP